MKLRNLEMGATIVNGTWGFSSGITHSDYIMAQGNIGVDPETGLPQEVVLMLIPKEDFEIQNTWKTVAQKVRVVIILH